MKGNNGKGNCIERDEWETPKLLFIMLNKQYNFTFDCCASEKNHKTENWSNNFIDIFWDLKIISWMNPPFSKAKEMFTHFFNVVNKGVAIYRCDNLETQVWQDTILKHADWIFIPKGRISYEGMPGKGSRFPSALIGIGLPPPKNIKGRLLLLK